MPALFFLLTLILGTLLREGAGDPTFLVGKTVRTRCCAAGGFGLTARRIVGGVMGGVGVIEGGVIPISAKTIERTSCLLNIPFLCICHKYLNVSFLLALLRADWFGDAAASMSIIDVATKKIVTTIFENFQIITVSPGGEIFCFKVCFFGSNRHCLSNENARKGLCRVQIL